MAIAIALAGWIDGWLGWLIAGAGMLSLAIAAVVIARRALEATDYDCLFAIHGL